MLNLVGTHIAKLNEEDLRELVFKLCEAELRRNNQSVASVTAGGKRRKLVQTRSEWRAVLPHALANRLAKQALANLPQSEVMSAFQGHDRLLRSFSRRLSYLHDSPEACAIAQSWISLEPAVRAPLLAAEIEIHCIGADGVLSWSPIAASLLGLAPNKQDVLDKFTECFHPRAWSGSISGVLRPFQELVMQLAKNEDATVAAWAKGQLALMADRIAHESRIDQRIDERFE